MRKLIFITMIAIATNAHAETGIKIEYDTKTEKVKILEKTNNKDCLKQVENSKKLLKSASNGKSGKIKMTFICY